MKKEEICSNSYTQLYNIKSHHKMTVPDCIDRESRCVWWRVTTWRPLSSLCHHCVRFKFD